MLQYVCDSFVLCVGAKGASQLRKKKYHTNAFCLKMRALKAFAFFSRSAAKIWEETWLNDATFDVMQLHGTRAGMHHGWAGGAAAVLFACDIPAPMFSAAQLHLHTCLYTSLDCAHMFDATHRRAWNSMCRLHEATCCISSTESGGWPEKICH